jgi:hypothetical protein
VTNNPTTTGGKPIPVLIKLMTSLLPQKLVKATAVPMETPMNRLMNVAVPDTFKDSHVIPNTSGSKLTINSKAFIIP